MQHTTSQWSAAQHAPALRGRGRLLLLLLVLLPGAVPAGW